MDFETLKQYTVSELSQLSEAEKEPYILVGKYLPSQPTTIAVKEFSFNDVQELKQLAQSGGEMSPDWVAKAMECEVKDLGTLKWWIYYGICHSIVEQVKEICISEAEYLQSKHSTPEWEQVQASERLQPFGVLNTLEILSGGDVTKYDAILAMPYSTIFAVLYRKRVYSDIQREITEIQTKKAKK